MQELENIEREGTQEKPNSIHSRNAGKMDNLYLSQTFNSSRGET